MTTTIQETAKSVSNAIEKVAKEIKQNENLPPKRLEISERLNKVQAKTGLTFINWSVKAGYYPNYISALKSKDSRVPITKANIKAIAQAAGVRFEYLWSGGNMFDRKDKKKKTAPSKKAVKKSSKSPTIAANSAQVAQKISTKRANLIKEQNSIRDEIKTLESKLISVNDYIAFIDSL